MRDSPIDCQAHCSEAKESPTSQFNNGGSTGRAEVRDRIQVGSKGNTSAKSKMEVDQMEGTKDDETTMGKDRWFATSVGLPAQDLEANTGCPVTARGDQIGRF